MLALAIDLAVMSWVKVIDIGDYGTMDKAIVPVVGFHPWVADLAVLYRLGQVV